MDTSNGTIPEGNANDPLAYLANLLGRIVFCLGILIVLVLSVFLIRFAVDWMSQMFTKEFLTFLPNRFF